MRRGSLSEYFSGVAAKRLARVEAEREASNQHEYQGIGKLREILGTLPRSINTQLIYLSDEDREPIEANAQLSWYDTRQNKPHRSAEWRLYFPKTAVSEAFGTGDLIVFALRQDGSLLIVGAEDGSTVLNQVKWLFGLNGETDRGFSVLDEDQLSSDQLDLTSRLILERIGVQVTTTDESALEGLQKKFGTEFPKTSVFSEYARLQTRDVDPVKGPDEAIMAWMDREEILFRTFERHLLSQRIVPLVTGAAIDFDGLMKFFLSAQNARKSRAGWAFENHLEALFKANGIRYSRSAKTEGNSKPDFLFPGAMEYHDLKFKRDLLTFLGAKTTCKDRWRQVLPEAALIPDKHLITLEPAISIDQINEMKANRLQLVVPEKLQKTYDVTQRNWLMNLDAFLQLVLDRQRQVP